MSLDPGPQPEGSMRKAVTVLVMGGYAGSVITERGSVGEGRKPNSRESTFQLMGLWAGSPGSF